MSDSDKPPPTLNHNSLPTWRKNKTEDRIFRDDKWWYWCPLHKRPGDYDGLYMTHLPGKHDEWTERKAMFRAKHNKSGKGVPSETPTGGSKLGITEAMKNALVTDHV